MNPRNNIGEIVELMSRDTSEDAPSDSIKWAKNLIKMRAVESPTSLVKKIMAVLSLDLAPNRSAFGERSQGVSQTLQLLYDAGDISVDLRVTYAGKKFGLRGQILGTGYIGSYVTIKGTAFQSGTTTNENSEFDLGKMPAGQYDLSILADEIEIMIENLEIR